jgi:hypothetical protein
VHGNSEAAILKASISSFDIPTISWTLRSKGTTSTGFGLQEGGPVIILHNTLPVGFCSGMKEKGEIYFSIRHVIHT